MDIIKVAGELDAALVGAGQPCRSPDGTGAPHARWMLQGIVEGYIQHEKAHRWLGYAQAIAVQETYATLDDVKKFNHSD